MRTTRNHLAGSVPVHHVDPAHETGSSAGVESPPSSGRQALFGDRQSVVLTIVQRCCCVLLAVVPWLAVLAGNAPLLCRADVVRLHSGGILRGTVLGEDAGNAEDAVTVELLTGARVIVDRASVESVEHRALKYEEYDLRVQTLPDTLDAHWQMAEWCRAQHMDRRRAVHLERVIEFDPEHRKARYGLGHTHHDGTWLTREQYEQRRRDEGFVKFDGKWVPANQLDSIKAESEQSKAELEWFPKVRLWMIWATGSRPERAADGLANLKNIRSPEAIPALIQFLGKDAHRDVRRLFVELLAGMDSPRVAVPLATLVVRDEDREIRGQSLDSLRESQHAIAQDYFVSQLRDDRNIVVRRSAEALAKVGNDDAVPALIRALITTHTYKVSVPVQTYSFGADGSLPQAPTLPPDIEAGLRLGVYDNVQVIPLLGARGATRIVPIDVTHENKEVHMALKHLTGQDFGYDERAWNRWWTVDRHQTKLAPDLP